VAQILHPTCYSEEAVMQTKVKFEHTGYTWQGRFLFGLLAAAWLFISLTFAGMFLAVGAIAALVIGTRLLWARRHVRHTSRRTGKSLIDGQYVVLDRQREGAGGADA
jgi:nitrate reductase gamma subunit